MKLSLILLLLCPVFAFSQTPIQYPNNRDFHYFTSEEIDSLDFHHIYELTKTKETGGMWENVDIMHFNFSPEHSSYSADWHAIYDSTDFDPNILELLPELENTFVNGSEMLLENDTMTYFGGYGYGTMTMNYYDYLDSLIIIERLTEKSPIQELGVITFYKNGLPKELIGWETSDLEEEDYYEEYDEFDLDFLNSNIELDTILYSYDENLKLNSIKDLSTGTEYFQLFEPIGAQPKYIFYQCYSGTTPLEAKLAESIGYLPSTVCFEISPLHVLVFKLDKKSSTYYYIESIELI